MISFAANSSTGRAYRVIRLLFQLLLLPLKLIMVPFKIIRTGITFVTCVVPVLLVAGVVAFVIWFFIVR